jgi:hypothetical protein
MLSFILPRWWNQFAWYSAVSSSVFWATIPCSSTKVSRRFRATYCLYLQVGTVSQATNQHETALLAACFMLVSFLAYSSTLMRQAIRYSETFVEFHRTTQCFITQDRNLHSHRGENLVLDIYYLLSDCFVSGAICSPINCTTLGKNISSVSVRLSYCLVAVKHSGTCSNGATS